jgi:DNA gyrase subunit A
MSKRGGKLAACFPIEATDGILLVTQGGQLIRTSVKQVRIAGRNTQGVTIFRTAGGERVVSVERLPDSGEDETGAEDAPAIGTET